MSAKAPVGSEPEQQQQGKDEVAWRSMTMAADSMAVPASSFLKPPQEQEEVQEQDRRGRRIIVLIIINRNRN